MVKYFSKFSVRLTFVVALVVGSAASVIQADPADDFSFTLRHASEKDAYHLMSQSRIEEVLRDRLDLFPVSQVPKLAKHIIHLCRLYRFDPAFVLSLIHVESGFRVKALSPKGALGLMQLMPATGEIIARDIGLTQFRPSALLDPFTNIRLGIAYLAWLRDRYRDLSPYYLVAAYNAGPGKIDEVLELEDRTQFHPVQTKKYFNEIRRQLPLMRYYRTGATPAASTRAALKGKNRV